MILSNLLSITPNQYLSAAILVLAALIILYLARLPFHSAMKALGNVIYRAARLLAAATLSANQRLDEHNRRALLALGRAQTHRILAREFKRIHSMTAKCMEAQPRLHRQTSEIIARIEDDYAKSADAAPGLPDWIPAIRAVAEIDRGQGSLVANMLKEIHHSLNEQQKKAAETYRQATAKRHRILTKWMPLWRRIDRQIQLTDRSIDKLNRQSESIDRYMAQYEAIENRDGQIEDLLRANVWKQFIISGLVLLVFIAAAFLDYHILSAAVGAISPATGRLGALTANQVTALVLVLLAMGAGVFLTESLRVTQIFPSVGSLEESLRRRFVWVSLTVALAFGGLQGLLVYHAPGPGPLAPRFAAGGSAFQPLAVIGPAALAAILSILVGFIPIPLETLTNATRTVAGMLARGLLGGLAIFFRLAGNLARAISRLLACCYDIIIFPAVWFEDAIGANRGAPSMSPGSAPALPKASSESSES